MGSFTLKYASDHRDLAIEPRVLNFVRRETQSGYGVGSADGWSAFMKCSLLAVDRDGAVEVRRGSAARCLELQDVIGE